MQEHISRILKGELADHYYGKNILNKLTELMVEKVYFKIISCAQSAKYFSAKTDCTPDIGHVERLSVTIRYVDITNENNDNENREQFLGFTSIDGSIVKGLTNIVVKFLVKNEVELKHNSGQEYDNAANMKGNNSAVQKRISDQIHWHFLCHAGAII
jgi:hypothetical protein